MELKKLDETKVLKDPVHSYIHIHYEVIWNCLDSKEFQRLRRIRQLGGDFQVYPTAEHSRFSHSLGVYEIVRRMVTEVKSLCVELTEYEKVCVMLAGLLHDVVEDTKWTLKELEAEGFPTGVLEAVRLLTREKDVPYMAYIERLSGNQIARKVKLADLEHNSDLTRLIEVTERDLRRQEKYFLAKEFLLRQEDT